MRSQEVQCEITGGAVGDLRRYSGRSQEVQCEITGGTV